ncbi:MAG: DUF6090 family protein [Rhodanobacteraceae bacterium]
MIGSRFVEHLKKQHWTGVFIELLIVVLGVFIGLQVDNWNQARQERQQQRSIEARLLTDFKLLDSQVDQAIDDNDRLIVALDTLRHAIRRGNARPDEDDRIKFAMNRFASYPTFIRFSSTYTELVSSGKLDLIKDEKLRVALARYDESARNGMFNVNSIGRRMEVGFVYPDQYLRLAPLDLQHLNADMVTGYDIAGMAKDKAWQSCVDFIYVLEVWIHSNLIFQKQAVERVLEMMGQHPTTNEKQRRKNSALQHPDVDRS